MILFLEKVMNDYVNDIIIYIRTIKMKFMNYLNKNNNRFKKLPLIVVKELSVIKM